MPGLSWFTAPGKTGVSTLKEGGGQPSQYPLQFIHASQIHLLHVFLLDLGNFQHDA